MVSPPLHPVGQESLEEGCARARQRAMGAQAVPVMPAPPQVAEILGAILVQLPVVDHREARRPLIEGILLLAHYHQETVLTALLRQPLPMERCVPWTGSHGPLCGPDQAPLTATDVSWRTGPSSSTGSEAGLGQALSPHPRNLGAREGTTDPEPPCHSSVPWSWSPDPVASHVSWSSPLGSIQGSPFIPCRGQSSGPPPSLSFPGIHPRTWSPRPLDELHSVLLSFQMRL